MKAQKNKRVVAIILNYMAWEECIECVYSLLQVDYPDHKIVIVENGSKNESFFKLTEAFENNPNVIILKSDKNLGFAKGNNIGIKYAKDILKADFVYVANSDTVMSSKRIYYQMINAYEDGIGVISPTVVQKNGQYHFPAVNTDKIYNLAFKGLLTVLIHSLITSKGSRKRQACQENDLISDLSLIRKKYIIHGCAYLLTPDFFEYYDGLYPKTFLYWEEINLLIYIQKAGLRSILVDTDNVVHKINASTDYFFTSNKDVHRTRMSLRSGIHSFPMWITMRVKKK